MKYFLITILTLFVSNLLIAENKILYVSSNGTGNGESWEDASSDLNAILFKAEAGTQVWVAKGTYFPTTDSDREIAFNIPSGVAVYGGFKGTEKHLNQRNFIVNKTILSGNIGETTAVDNSFNVIFFVNASATTILDGFIIQDGTGTGTGTTGERNRCGAGVYIYATGSAYESSPQIANCILKNNASRDGGAVYNNSNGGRLNPRFQYCEFYSNKADFDGGAIYNDGRNGGSCKVTLIGCILKGNQANYGGAICNFAGDGMANSTLKNCTVSDNEAIQRGDTIFDALGNGAK